MSYDPQFQAFIELSESGFTYEFDSMAHRVLDTLLFAIVVRMRNPSDGSPYADPEYKQAESIRTAKAFAVAIWPDGTQGDWQEIASGEEAADMWGDAAAQERALDKFLE